MKKKSYTTFAAIHLGSEMISMQIVEYRNMNKVKVIEQCNHRVKLGEETFKNKIIPFSMVSEICELLQGYKRLMSEYGVEECSVQATTAVREALNQVFLLDQIYIKTGLKVKVVDMPQEIYTKYTAIRQTLRSEGINGKDYGMLLMDISSGGLGITFVDDEKIKYQQNFHVGIIRIKESFNRNQRNGMQFNLALTEFLASTMGPVREALKDANIRYLILSGTETELLLQMQGLLSVNTERQKERTAYTILNEYVQRSGRQFRVFIVHRLDRDTSGLMMFAKDEKTQRTLRDNWHEIVTDRRYVAVVEGSMEKDYDTVVSWLTDKTLYVSSSEYDDGGSKSITHYKTIKRANGYSLLELDLETGRKNQIRVHMQDLGHPIIGDGRYGREDSPNPIGRLALHAFKLCFYPPVTGDLMEFETPYPAEFKKLFLKK